MKSKDAGFLLDYIDQAEKFKPAGMEKSFIEGVRTHFVNKGKDLTQRQGDILQAIYRRAYK